MVKEQETDKSFSRNDLLKSVGKGVGVVVLGGVLASRIPKSEVPPALVPEYDWITGVDDKAKSFLQDLGKVLGIEGLTPENAIVKIVENKAEAELKRLEMEAQLKAKDIFITALGSTVERLVGAGDIFKEVQNAINEVPLRINEVISNLGKVKNDLEFSINQFLKPVLGIAKGLLDFIQMISTKINESLDSLLSPIQNLQPVKDVRSVADNLISRGVEEVGLVTENVSKAGNSSFSLVSTIQSIIGSPKGTVPDNKNTQSNKIPDTLHTIMADTSAANKSLSLYPVSVKNILSELINAQAKYRTNLQQKNPDDIIDSKQFPKQPNRSQSNFSK